MIFNAYQCKNSLMFVVVDFITAILIRATGQKLLLSRHKSFQVLNLSKLVEASGAFKTSCCCKSSLFTVLIYNCCQFILHDPSCE